MEIQIFIEISIVLSVYALVASSVLQTDASNGTRCCRNVLQKPTIHSKGCSTEVNRTVADNLSKEVRVLCWVMTMPNNHATKARSVKATWGTRCNILLFMSSTYDPALPTIKLELSSEGRDYLWAKTKGAFKHVYEHHFNDADWFMKADDDTYVVVENLRLLLSEYNTSDAIYFGSRLYPSPKLKQGYMSGGAGYVLSKEALTRFVNKGLPSPDLCRVDHGGFEDLEMGICLNNVGVKAIDPPDSLGRSRFFLTNHRELLKWGYGLDICSDSAISFHYVDDTFMYVMDYLLYHLKPHGIYSNHIVPKAYIKEVTGTPSHENIQGAITNTITEKSNGKDNPNNKTDKSTEKGVTEISKKETNVTDFHTNRTSYLDGSGTTEKSRNKTKYFSANTTEIILKITEIKTNVLTQLPSNITTFLDRSGTAKMFRNETKERIENTTQYFSNVTDGFKNIDTAEKLKKNFSNLKNDGTTENSGIKTKDYSANTTEIILKVTEMNTNVLTQVPSNITIFLDRSGTTKMFRNETTESIEGTTQNFSNVTHGFKNINTAEELKQNFSNLKNDGTTDKSGNKTKDDSANTTEIILNISDVKTNLFTQLPINITTLLDGGGTKMFRNETKKSKEGTPQYFSNVTDGFKNIDTTENPKQNYSNLKEKAESTLTNTNDRLKEGKITEIPNYSENKKTAEFSNKMKDELKKQGANNTSREIQYPTSDLLTTGTDKLKKEEITVMPKNKTTTIVTQTLTVNSLGTNDTKQVGAKNILNNKTSSYHKQNDTSTVTKNNKKYGVKTNQSKKNRKSKAKRRGNKHILPQSRRYMWWPMWWPFRPERQNIIKKFHARNKSYDLLF